jgi:hypothetical protein
MKLLVAPLSLALIITSAPAAALEPVQPSVVSAPSIERLELARRFVRLTVSPDRFIETMREGSVQAAIAMSGDDAEFSQADLEREVAKFFVQVEPKIRAQLPNILEAYAQAYAREFSPGELEDLVNFGESTAGKHYLAKADLIDLEPEVLGAFDAMQAEFLPVLEQLKKDKCTEKAAQRIAAGDTKAKCKLGASG